MDDPKCSASCGCSNYARPAGGAVAQLETPPRTGNKVELSLLEIQEEKGEKDEYKSKYKQNKL